MLGANRPDVETSSRGRGLLEVEEMLLDVVNDLDTTDGIEIDYHASGAADFTAVDSTYIATRDYNFEAILTADKFYHPPTNLAGSEAAGTVTLTWDLPAVRYDTRRVMIRRVAGSSPDPGPGSGDGTVRTWSVRPFRERWAERARILATEGKSK